jgi:hypothetical protein
MAMETAARARIIAMAAVPRSMSTSSSDRDKG